MKIAKLFLLFVLVCHSFILNAIVPGTFQQITGSPFGAGNAPASSAYSPIVSGNLFVATPNYGGQSVSVYEANQTTGVLTQVAGSPFATGVNPAWQAFSPLASGNLFAAVVNLSDNTVSVYEVNQTTGAFTPVIGAPFATGSQPSNVEFSPIVSGNLFAAVPNSADDTVSVYEVNQTTGVLTQVAGSPFATGTGPSFAIFSPSASGNLFAAVTNMSDNTVSVYEVNQTTGAFTPVSGSPFATGAGPYSVDFSPIVSGNLFAAVVNLHDNTVSVYEVDQSTGLFTQVSGSPFATGGTGANEIAFSPVVEGELFAAVVNFNSNNVSVFQVDQTTGAFTQISTSPFATGGGPDGIAFSPLLSGNLFAAVANYFDNTVSVYQVVTPPPTPPVVLPPSNFIGVIIKNRFLNKTECVLQAQWEASPSPNVVEYRLYKNNQLVDVVPSTSPLIYITCLSNCSAVGYTITAVNSINLESIPVPLTIVGFKAGSREKYFLASALAFLPLHK